MPQDDYVEPVDKQYLVQEQAKVTLNDKNNLLISDEVQKDIQYHLHDVSEYRAENEYDKYNQDDNVKGNRRNTGGRAVVHEKESKEPDFVSDSRTHRRKDFSRNQNIGHNTFVSSTQNDDNPDVPVLKLDIRAKDTATVTMPTIPISGGGDSMAVTMATNHGQIPLYDVNVRSYENPFEIQQMVKPSGRHDNRKINFQPDERRKMQNTFLSNELKPRVNFKRQPNKYNSNVKVSKQSVQTPSITQEELTLTVRDEVNEDSTTGNLPPPFKDSNSSPHKPTRESSKISVNMRHNKYRPKPKSKPRNSFRRMYFSRHTPDLRFKRDLSRFVRTPLDQVDHMSLDLHDVTIEDEAMYECQVKPLGGPARWGRAQLNVHGNHYYDFLLYQLCYDQSVRFV